MSERARIEAAHRRIRGQLVATPIVGGPCLPGHGCPIALRVKLELLQVGGSIWFRGAMHALARRLGATKGIVAYGRFRFVIAWATAASLQRVPIVVLAPEAELADSDRRVLLDAIGGDVAIERVGDEAAAVARVEAIRAERGFAAAVGPGDPDFDDGLATVGLELATELASDVERVLVSPREAAPPIAAGLSAGGRTIDVEGVEPDPARSAARLVLADSVRLGMRVCCDPAGLSALDLALRLDDDAHLCAVVGE